MDDASGLGVAGFALTAAGALVAGIGTTVAWTSTGLRRDLQGALDLEFRGIDLTEGIATLVIAGATLAGLVLVRRLGGTARVRAAVGLLVAGVVLVALPAWVALRAEDRAVDDVARVVADAAGITVEEASDRVRIEPDLGVRTDSRGAWVSIAGGGLVIVGAGATLSWTVRSAADPAGEGS
jgi:hypothetical protein